MLMRGPLGARAAASAWSSFASGGVRRLCQTQRLYDVVAYVVLFGAFSFAVFPILWTLLTSLKANADIVTAELGSKAQEDAGDRRDKALAKLTPQEREDMETICLTLAAMCKRKPA